VSPFVRCVQLCTEVPAARQAGGLVPRRRYHDSEMDCCRVPRVERGYVPDEIAGLVVDEVPVRRLYVYPAGEDERTGAVLSPVGGDNRGEVDDASGVYLCPDRSTSEPEVQAAFLRSRSAIRLDAERAAGEERRSEDAQQNLCTMTVHLFLPELA